MMPRFKMSADIGALLPKIAIDIPRLPDIFFNKKTWIFMHQAWNPGIKNC